MDKSSVQFPYLVPSIRALRSLSPMRTFVFLADGDWSSLSDGHEALRRNP